MDDRDMVSAPNVRVSEETPEADSKVELESR